MAFLTFLGIAGALGLSIKAISHIQRLETELRSVDQRLRRFEAGSVQSPQNISQEPPRPAVAADWPQQPSAASIQSRPQENQAAKRPFIFGSDWERLLVENWLVWLGGVTLALGGAFLVKLSVDHGLLTPAVRVFMGALLGMGLVSAADWAVRHGGSAGRSYVPQALAAAGSAILFSDILAAYQLYGLLSATPAFILLAGTAALTLAMSLKYGPFVAALGLLGAYIIPVLIHSTEPHSLPLFSYLTIVTAAAVALLRYKTWNWLGWLTLTGALGWVLIWLAGPFIPADTIILGSYLILLLGIFASLRQDFVFGGRVTASVQGSPMLPLVRASFWLVSYAVIPLTVTDHFMAMSLCWLGAVMLAVLGIAFLDEQLDDLLAAAALPLLVSLAIWKFHGAGPAAALFARAIPSSDSSLFEAVAIIGAVLLGASGFAASHRRPHPGRWAALAVAAPLAVLAISYWRLAAFEPDIAWGAIGVVLAVVDLIAAERVLRFSNDARRDEALAAFAIGAAGSTCLAAAMVLREAWLTVILALHLPILGWVEGRIRLPALRQLAVAVSAIVLIRLVLNPEILHYSSIGGQIVNWLLYGYGIPAVAFVVATKQFSSRFDDLLVKLLEAGSIVFMTALVTFELRQWLGHTGIDLSLHNLLKDSPETSVWLVMAAVLLRGGNFRQRQIISWGGIILFCVATLQAVFWQALLANPLLSGASVGAGLLFNTLLVAYALPACLYGGIGIIRLGPPALWHAARGLALAFSLLWLTLEVRHGFRGEFLIGNEGSEAEWYAYSVAWLLFAVILLALGLYYRCIWLRKVALAGIGLVVAKVFLSDTADLTGVWRALSFIGLGGTLIAIGYAYRNLVPSAKDGRGQSVSS